MLFFICIFDLLYKLCFDYLLVKVSITITNLAFNWNLIEHKCVCVFTHLLID